MHKLLKSIFSRLELNENEEKKEEEEEEEEEREALVSDVTSHNKIRIERGGKYYFIQLIMRSISNRKKNIISTRYIYI